MNKEASYRVLGTVAAACHRGYGLSKRAGKFEMVKYSPLKNLIRHPIRTIKNNPGTSLGIGSGLALIGGGSAYAYDQAMKERAKNEGVIDHVADYLPYYAAGAGALTTGAAADAVVKGLGGGATARLITLLLSLPAGGVGGYYLGDLAQRKGWASNAKDYLQDKLGNI